MWNVDLETHTVPSYWLAGELQLDPIKIQVDYRRALGEQCRQQNNSRSAPIVWKLALFSGFTFRISAENPVCGLSLHNYSLFDEP